MLSAGAADLTAPWEDIEGTCRKRLCKVEPEELYLCTEMLLRITVVQRLIAHHEDRGDGGKLSRRICSLSSASTGLDLA